MEPMDAVLPSDVPAQAAGEATPVAAIPEPLKEESLAKALIAAPQPKPPARKPEVIQVSRPSGSHKGVWIVIAVAIALIIAGPPIFLVAQALAYPFLILLCCVALWKVYGVVRTANRKAEGKD